jgi:hypothetical protein
MNKYGFRIRTRTGMVVENLQVHARDRAEAEQKIHQIYHHCEILQCHEVTPTLRKEGLDLSDVVALINRQEDKPAAPAESRPAQPGQGVTLPSLRPGAVSAQDAEGPAQPPAEGGDREPGAG